MTRPQIDFFFSFRSPYSYLAAPRAFALAERYDVEVQFHGVMPMAMRGQSVSSGTRALAWHAAMAACNAYRPRDPPSFAARSSAAKPRRMRSWSQSARF